MTRTFSVFTFAVDMNSRPRLAMFSVLSFLIACVALMAASGCAAVPLRVPTKTRDVSGKPLEVDFTFLKSGSTTRDEVNSRLTAIDTHVNQSNLFWGRWDSSKWRSTAVGFVPPDGERIWRAHNLLIQFDQNGIVKNWGVTDDKKLAQQLDLFDPVAADAPLDLSIPLRAEARVPYPEADAGLVLSSDSFEYSILRTFGPMAHARSNATTLTTPRTNVLKIVPAPGAFYNGPLSGMVPFLVPNLLVAKVYFARPAEGHYGKKGHFATKKLELAMDPPTFLLLRRYIRQASPAALITLANVDCGSSPCEWRSGHGGWR
jgi:hypothetical protein